MGSYICQRKHNPLPILLPSYSCEGHTSATNTNLKHVCPGQRPPLTRKWAALFSLTSSESIVLTSLTVYPTLCLSLTLTSVSFLAPDHYRSAPCTYTHTYAQAPPHPHTHTHTHAHTCTRTHAPTHPTPPPHTRTCT